MTPDIEELKRLAQQATPGPWTQWVEHGDVWSGVPERNSPGNMGGGSLGIRVCECDADDYAGDDDEEAEAQAKATAAYIAAANPQAILALIKRLETLEDEHKGTVRLTLEQLQTIRRGWNASVRSEQCTLCRDGFVNCSRCKADGTLTAEAEEMLVAAIKEAQGE